MTASGVGAFDRAVTRRPIVETSATLPQISAKIIRFDKDGAWCTPLGSNITTNLLGPCRGGYYRETGTCVAGSHLHPLVPLPVGTIVKVVRAQAGSETELWIDAVDWRP